jgi:hypothetical protein
MHLDSETVAFGRGRCRTDSRSRVWTGRGRRGRIGYLTRAAIHRRVDRFAAIGICALDCREAGHRMYTSAAPVEVLGA